MEKETPNEENGELSFHWAILIPNNFEEEVKNNKVSSIFHFFKKDLLVSFTTIVPKTISDQELESILGRVYRTIYNTKQYLTFVDDELIKSDLEAIMTIINNGGKYSDYEIIFIRLLALVQAESMECVQALYNTPEQDKYVLTFYFSNNKDLLGDMHERSLSEMRNQAIMKLKRKKTSNRTPIGTKFRHEVFKRDGYRCVECGKSKENSEEVCLEVDHILPVSQGGSDELINLRTLCKQCNGAKANRKW